MKIVVLDGYALNPGDLSWDAVERFGDLVVYERSPAETVCERSRDAEILLTNKTILTPDVIRQLPKLKLIQVLATGYNVVDTDAARELGITVCNIPAYSTESVAQLVLSMILEHCQHVAAHSSSVKAGDWANCPDFAYWNFPLVELAGSTLGVVGYGSIAKATIRMAQAFGMKILVHTRTIPEEAPEGVTFADLDTVFAESDFVTLHCPLTSATEKMVNHERLDKMKTSAFLVNTGRGGLLDEEAVANALNEGRIAGAGLDVLSTEPPKGDNPLLNARNTFITPHLGWATVQARSRLMGTLVENLRAFNNGHCINVVN